MFGALRWTGLVAILCGTGFMALTGMGVDSEERLRLIRDSLQGRAASGKIVIVEIDARSLSSISTWPWPRSRHGELVSQLRAKGAGTIAFDVDFSSHSIPAEDAAFAAALDRAGNDVILPTFVQQESSLSEVTSENMPIDALRDHAFVGSVNVQTDPDGQLRHYSYGVITGGMPRPSIAALMAESNGAVGENFRIDVAIDPATIPRISAVDLISGNVPAAAIRGKTMLIGATAVEMGDRNVLPGHGILPGVVIQALAAETLLQHTINPDLGPWLPFLLAMATVVFYHLKPDRWVNPWLLGGTAALILVVPFVFERAGAGTFTIVPALTLIGLAAGWSGLLGLNRAFNENRLRDSATGLPNLRALLRRQDLSGQFVVARLQQWDEMSAVLSPTDRSALMAQIVARFATAFPDAEPHAIENGVLAWRLSTPELDGVTDTVEGAAALFRLPMQLERRALLVTPVFGIQTIGENAATALSQAQLAARQAQDAGRRWRVHSAGAASATERALALLADIDGALTGGDLHLVYQPKFDIAANRIGGAEALIRWQHKTLGPVRPDEFIPLLEEAGHIAALSLFVVDSCIADLARWGEDAAHLGVSVNISAALLNDTAFTAALTARLDALGGEARRITLEITESAAIDQAAPAIALLETWRARGVRISIDDYGTGHATLSYLKSFPADEIKIDKSFVTAILTNNSDQILVRSTIELAHELGFKVVAEGVEDAPCLAKLREFRCDVAQGWLIGKPMPAEAFVALALGEARAIAA